MQNNVRGWGQDIQPGYALADPELTYKKIPGAPGRGPLSPQQRLVVALILDAIRAKDIKWLFGTGTYLCCYLPDSEWWQKNILNTIQNMEKEK